MYTLLAYIYPSFIHTKLFWKIVKKHFNNPKEEPYLCHKSPLFKAYWLEYRIDFIKLAHLFLLETKYDKADAGRRESGYIFYSKNEPITEEVRTYFINWCIRKYSK